MSLDSSAFCEGQAACNAIAALCEARSIKSMLSNVIIPLQGSRISKNDRVPCSLSININTNTGRLSSRRPYFQNQSAFRKDKYKIRQAFLAPPQKTFIVAAYGQLELRVLAHITDCKSMLEAFRVGEDFHLKIATEIFPREADNNGVDRCKSHSTPGQRAPSAPPLKDVPASNRRKAKMLNFCIAYHKTPERLAKDLKVSVYEAKEKIDQWFSGREEVLLWQSLCKQKSVEKGAVSLLGRLRLFPARNDINSTNDKYIERAAIDTIIQMNDEVILEGPELSAHEAQKIVEGCMLKPFNGENILTVPLLVDAKFTKNLYTAM